MLTNVNIFNLGQGNNICYKLDRILDKSTFFSVEEHITPGSMLGLRMKISGFDSQKKIVDVIERIVSLQLQWTGHILYCMKK